MCLSSFAFIQWNTNETTSQSWNMIGNLRAREKCPGKHKLLVLGNYYISVQTYRRSVHLNDAYGLWCIHDVFIEVYWIIII